jgi:DNA modification methylase
MAMKPEEGQAMKNQLYYGDNLEVMRRYIEDETIDLVYLDPPFNSNANYNVLFAEKDGSKAASQIEAFTDTWTWTQESESVFADVVTGGGKVSDCLQAFRTFLGECDLLAYLVMMAPRLVEMRRVLKPTGSIYLHCDPTASHYLKMLMDAIYGPTQFKNEITWKRTSAHNDPGRYGANVDILLFYVKGNKWTWNTQYTAHDEAYKARFRNADADGRLWSDYDLSAKGLSGGGYDYEYKGVRSYWRCPIRTMKRLDKAGKLHFTSKGGIRLKRYLDETPGVPLQCLWDDIFPINSQAAERLGYPTQKPVALLERIIQVSSNEGDTVLDPFCGCGTTIAAAAKLKRRWIGIDVTQLAITLIKKRLHDSFGDRAQFDLIGEPMSVADAAALAEADPYQFQWWALGKVHARPAEQKKGADSGIDGRILFRSGEKEYENVILSVKAGKTSVPHVRDLKGVLEREKAAIGVLISMQEPTKPMIQEAVTAGFYESDTFKQKYPKVQLLTVKDLFNGKTIEMPPRHWVDTFKKAKSVSTKREEELELL